MIIPEVYIDYLVDIGWVSTDCAPKKGIDKNATKESLQCEISQLYGKCDLVEQNESYVTAVRPTLLYAV